MSLLRYDRPVAFNPAFVRLGVGVTGALLLSQGIYWHNRTESKDHWFYKTQDDWERETGLTRREQETARKKLRNIGVLEEKKYGIPCKTYYRVNEQALIALLDGLDNPPGNDVADEQPRMAECAKQCSANPPNSAAQNSQAVQADSADLLHRVPDSTTEITTEIPLNPQRGDKPVSQKTKLLQEQAREIISYLNDNNRKLADELGNSRPRGFTHSETNLKNIIGRLKEFTVEDCKLVLDYLHQRWGHNPEMREYLTVTTIFRKSKFEERLVAAAGWEVSGRPQYRNGRWQNCADVTEQRRTQAALDGLKRKAR